jgi:magnesium-transporting ATPase (P-type)
MQTSLPPENGAGIPWHALASQDVLQTLDAPAQGLSTDMARARLREHGPNQLPAPRKKSDFVRFAAQFNSALIYFLLTATVLAFFLGHKVDASVILLVVLVNAIVGFVQEGRAEQALAALRAVLMANAPPMTAQGPTPSA